MDGTTDGGSTAPLIPEHISKPSWKYRRIIIYGSLVLDALILIAILVGWFLGLEDATVMQIIAGGVIARSTAVIGSYVFGAAFDDMNVMKMFSSVRTGVSSFGRTGL